MMQHLSKHHCLHQLSIQSASCVIGGARRLLEICYHLCDYELKESAITHWHTLLESLVGLRVDQSWPSWNALQLQTPSGNISLLCPPPSQPCGVLKQWRLLSDRCTGKLDICRFLRVIMFLLLESCLHCTYREIYHSIHKQVPTTIMWNNPSC